MSITFFTLPRRFYYNKFRHYKTKDDTLIQIHLWIIGIEIVYGGEG